MRKQGSRWRWEICILFFTPALVRWLKRCFNGRWRREDNLPLFSDKPFVLMKFSLADDYGTLIVAENCIRCKRGARKTLNLMWRTNYFGELQGNWWITWKKTPAVHHRFCRGNVSNVPCGHKICTSVTIPPFHRCLPLISLKMMPQTRFSF